MFPVTLVLVLVLVLVYNYLHIMKVKENLTEYVSQSFFFLQNIINLYYYFRVMLKKMKRSLIMNKISDLDFTKLKHIMLRVG